MGEREGPRILIVDDDVVVGAGATLSLEKSGYTVDVVTSGEEAVERVAGGDAPNLILMDIDLGAGIDGATAARQILADRDVPIVFMSSHTESEIVRRTEGIASYGFIVKGSPDAVVRAAIGMALRLWRTTKERDAALATRDALFQQVPGAIYQYRYYPDGRSCFPFASPNIELVYEVRPEDVVDDASPVFSRIHPEDYDAVVDSITTSYRDLSVWEHDYRVILPQRGLRWLRGRARPEALPDGSVLWHGFITDITAITEVNARVREQAHRYRGVIEGTNVGTWEWNVGTGETRFNERWAEMVGYTLDELRPTTIETWTQLVHPDDAALSDVALQRHFAGDAPFYECTVRMRHRDGHWIWVLDRGKVLSRTPAGDPEWMFGTHQDVTVATETATRLEMLFEHTPAIVALIDAQSFRVVSVNRMFTTVLGFARDEAVGALLHDLLQIGETVREGVSGELDRGGHVDGVEATLTAKSGESIAVIFSAVRLAGGSGPLTLISGFDIRARRRAEAKLRGLIAEKETLLAELNHRTKNNLAMVSSLISLAGARSTTRVDLDDLATRVRTIATLHEELEGSTSYQSVDLHDYLARTLSFTFDSRGYPIVTTIDVDHDEVPNVEATTIGLIVNELATNAVKYAFSADDRNEFVVRGWQECDERVLTIANSGSPIPAGVTVDSSTGLGMQLVHALAERIGGTVSLSRDPRTEFTIRYPAARS